LQPLTSAQVRACHRRWLRAALWYSRQPEQYAKTDQISMHACLDAARVALQVLQERGRAENAAD
jgi:hypothetical protein